ncbi:replication initiator protein [Microvirus sp.]|nr:replication initiator protein [Microvirus sp.]
MVLLLTTLVLNLNLTDLIFDMCFSPVTIHNPKKYLHGFIDRSVLEVPCGTCKECIDSRRNSFFIRMYYEYLQVHANHGFAYFLTLTYNNESINRLPTGELCYRHDDVKNYLKLIRTHIQRDFNIETKDNIRYFCCSEFGEDRHRPHYHIVFFVYPPISARTFIYIARKYWAHGFTKAGKFNNGIVTDIAAFSYVSKYCTKGDEDGKTYKNLLSAIEKYPFSDEEKKYYRYNCRPIIRTSINFGLYLLETTDFEQIEKGIVKMPDKKYTVKNYPLPLYYDRKVFYDTVLVDGNPCYRLNAAGLQMKLIRFKQYKQSFKSCYDLVTSTKFSPTIFYSINLRFKTKFQSNKELFSWFNATINYDWENLFNYSLVYNGYSYSCIDASSLDFMTSAYQDFSTRLKLQIGLPVSDDEIQSLNYNTSFYNFDYALVLRVLRYLYGECNRQKISDFFAAENIRHRLTSTYYKTNVYI